VNFTKFFHFGYMGVFQFWGKISEVCNLRRIFAHDWLRTKLCKGYPASKLRKSEKFAPKLKCSLVTCVY
jgi:hypothetical protein